MFAADAVPDVVLLVDARSLAILDVNRADTAFGHAVGLLKGRALADFVPGLTAELLRKALAGTHDPHPDTPLRVSFVDVAGHAVPVDVKLARVFVEGEDAIACSLRVLSERARAAEREIVSIMGAVPVAIVTWSLEGIITSWNRTAQDLFGWTGDEATGKKLELIAPDVPLAESRAPFVDVGWDDAPPPREQMRRGKEGELLVEERLFSVRDVAGRLVRLGAVYRDLSDVARLRRATEALSKRSSDPVAATGAMSKVMESATIAAKDGKATILLLGETGVGKSHLARWIHERSPRRDKPFLEVNCAGLDAQLAESELFGHERGAFTGAVGQKRGLVEAADGGTLLLDEVAELPQPVQAKLLTFLDSGAFRRIGGLKRLTADVRIVAATNVDLEKAVAAGAFRKDLYFRLRVIPVDVPPLRARKDEIPAIAEGILADLSRARGLAPRTVASDARRALVMQDWPGNLRQLKNALEHALIVGPNRPGGGDVVTAADLPLEVRPAAALAEGAKLDDVVRRHIEAVLADVGGNRTKAAEILGIDRATLRRRLGEA
jgi:PAS domain S-box-containing protein